MCPAFEMRQLRMGSPPQSLADGRPPPRYRSRRAHPRLGQTMAAACSNWDHFLDDWHVCDIARPRMDFRFGGKSGHATDIAPRTEFDPMYGPAVQSRGLLRIGGCAVLHQSIRPLVGACRAPGHHGYQRACDLVTGQASNGPFGSPVSYASGKTDSPSRFVLSHASAG